MLEDALTEVFAAVAQLAELRKRHLVRHSSAMQYRRIWLLRLLIRVSQVQALPAAILAYGVTVAHLYDFRRFLFG